MDSRIYYKVVSFMAYRTNLNAHQQLIIENRHIQTSLVLISSSPGQQRSQSSGFTTGHWTRRPQLFKIPSGLLLQIDSERGEYFFQIQASGIQALTTAPLLNKTQPLELQEIHPTATSPTKMGFEPMTPMKPMEMGNMSMSMNPMSMRMGNMSMEMGKEEKSISARHFCPQCGQVVEANDRFCRSCGHQLKP